MNMTMIDSGIGWLGQIPSDWELYKGKYIFSLRTTKGNLYSKQLLSPTQKYGVIPQELYEKLSGMNAVKLSETTDYSTLKTVHVGDYCISLRSFQGGFEYSNYEGVVSPAYQIFYPIREVDRRYYKYLFKDDRFITEMNSFTMSLRDGKPISFSDFGNSIIPYPSLTEQHRIADYLDKKCASIDAAIDAGEKEIEKFKTYKQSVVANAVTKGLNPNVEMKDSGLIWMGKIPKHWGVTKLKYLYDNSHGSAVRVGPFGSSLSTSDYTDEGIWVYTQRTVIDNDFVNNDVRVSEAKALELHSFNVSEGDILITTRGTLGKVAIVPQYAPRGILHPCLIRFRVQTDRFNPRLLMHMFNNSDFFMNQINYISNGTTIDALYSYNLKDLILPEIPMEEQAMIIEYLDNKCSGIDSLISTKTQQISKLKAYKKSLIYTYVTGKKEVPNG